MSDPNDYQIGGDHYKTECEHWDLIEDHGIGYLEACASKYVTRWRKKESTADLQKALHYIEKLIHIHTTRNRVPRGVAPLSAIMLYSKANKLTKTEEEIVRYLCRWNSIEHLQYAHRCIRQLMEEAQDV